MAAPFNKPKVEQCSNGYWIVREPSVQWLAWWEWMSTELGITFKHHTFTTYSEWPPETVTGADAVAAAWNKIREDEHIARKLPEHPFPWKRWTPMQVVARQDAYHAESGNNIIPRTKEQIDALIAATRKRNHKFYARFDPKTAPAEEARSKPLTSEELATRENECAAARLALLNRFNPTEPTHHA